MLTDRIHAILADRTDRKNWMDPLTAEEVSTLRDLSAVLKDAMGKTTPDEDVLSEADFHSLWIGLLIGSGACDSADTADAWSTFVRYRTDGLIA